MTPLKNRKHPKCYHTQRPLLDKLSFCNDLRPHPCKDGLQVFREALAEAGQSHALQASVRGMSADELTLGSSRNASLYLQLSLRTPKAEAPAQPALLQQGVHILEGHSLPSGGFSRARMPTSPMATQGRESSVDESLGAALRIALQQSFHASQALADAEAEGKRKPQALARGLEEAGLRALLKGQAKSAGGEGSRKPGSGQPEGRVVTPILARAAHCARCREVLEVLEKQVGL